MATTALKRPPAGQSGTGLAHHHARSGSSTTLFEHYVHESQRDPDIHGEPGPGAGPAAEINQPSPNRDLGTRNLNIVGLIFGWCAAIASTAIGIYIIVTGPIQVPPFLLDRAVLVGNVAFAWSAMPQPTLFNPYIRDHRVFSVPQPAMLVIPLVLQMAITLVFGCLNSIHSTTLRWELWHEGRLRHNRNLRLFTSTRRTGPNKWPANIVSGLGLAFAYGGATVMVFTVYIMGSLEIRQNELSIDPEVDGNRYGIDFNAWGLLGLGIGLFLQAIVSTWCLFHDKLVGTWSVNPLATARVFKRLRDAGRSSVILHSTRPTPPRTATPRPDKATSVQPLVTIRYRACGAEQSEHAALHLPLVSVESVVCCEPDFTQPSASSLVPATRKIVRLVWAAFAVVAIWTVVVAIIATKHDTVSWQFVEDRAGHSDFLGFWQVFGQVSIFYTPNPYEARREWIGLLIQCAVFSLLLLNLHLVEHLVQLSMDEASWRKAATAGTRIDSSPLFDNARSWRWWVIFVYKFLVPWVFSYAFACNTAVFMALLPLLTLAVLFLTLALFAEYIIRARPKGAQPATYGDIHGLVALIDDWDHEKLYWGDKGEYAGGIRIAGTDGHRLADPRPGILYTGLCREPGYGPIL